MRNITVILFVFFAFLLTLSCNAGADTRSSKVFKCSGEKINDGDTTYSVLKKCGEPAFKELLSNEGCERKERWHYDCYGRGYVEELIFKKGILVDRLRGEDSQGTQNCN
jgi:hypothetical protein